MILGTHIDAAERMGELHDRLKASGFEGHDLEVLLVRLLFCLFAVQVDVDQFYVIEIEEFPVQVAQVALWLTDHQMNQKVSAEFGLYFARLPLLTSPTIVHANALRFDWQEVVPKKRLSFILGNPPFVGKKEQTDSQKEDLRLIFGGMPGAGVLDYVTCWYVKAANLIQGSDVRVAFVSTNSISQGEHPGLLWPVLWKKGVKIHFAHRTFRWSNEAKGRAAVHCVIIGFGANESPRPLLFDYSSPGAPAHVPGGSLINDRAIDARLQERAAGEDNVRTFRTSLNTLGDGFIEAIADGTIEAIRASQPQPLRGTILRVPVLEAPGVTRVGRFGWKNQHASLLSFSADAYLNEMGITSPLQPTENTSNGRLVAEWDAVPDPEEPATADEPFGEDVEIFARFMRATKVPPRDAELAAKPEAVAGRNLFASIGCANCHRPDVVTAPAGTPINGGTFVIPPALGDKIIHPYSDFLLHDVGTGDGIVQNGGPQTRNQLRTPPLWGLRTRDRLMHDGLALTRNDAILRHGGQAAGAAGRYRSLPLHQKNQLVEFLNSL